MQRRRFLIASVASVAGMWGCGGSSNNTDFAGGQNPQGGLLLQDVVFSSNEPVEVEANINGRGDVVYAVRVIGTPRSNLQGHIGRSRAGASATPETLVQPGEFSNLQFRNPRCDLTGDAVSWLEVEGAQTRIGAILRGARIAPWLPPAGFAFVQNLGLDGDGHLYAIAEDASGNSLLLRGDESSGTLIRYQFPFSGRLRMRMERGCRYAVGVCSAGVIAFVLEGGVPRFQVLSTEAASNISVNGRGDIGLLAASGDLRFFRREPILPAFPGGVQPPPGNSTPVDPAMLMGQLFIVVSQALSQAAQNATNEQQQQYLASQAATVEGIVAMYTANTAATGMAAGSILGLVALPNGAAYPLNNLFTQQPGQEATELDIQERQCCVTLNAARGRQAQVQILRFIPAAQA